MRMKKKATRIHDAVQAIKMPYKCQRFQIRIKYSDDHFFGWHVIFTNTFIQEDYKCTYV